MSDARPSKKQRELFAYIDSFIKGNGYGPSYREVMRALDYKSVSTVAVHVDALIAHGLLRKKDNSARSLEVVNSTPTKSQRELHMEWLERELKKCEADGLKKEASVLDEALKILRREA